MGGNALAAFGATRHDREEYLTLRDEVLAKLAILEGYYGWKEIPSYFSKDSFGDLDILFTNRDNNTFDEVLALFDNPPHYRNSNVLSILYKNLQVDLIGTDGEDYNISQVYFSYNDLGNLMGKLYHKFGLKYGHNGLVMPLRDEGNTSHKFGEVVISKDPRKIFEFLGLSYSRFLSGFKDLPEIFNFVISSPYFSKEIFSFENMNNAARVRDKKRNTYNAFLKYIESPAIKDNNIGWNSNKSYYLDRIFEFFPEAYYEYKYQYRVYTEWKEYKAKFNGTKVREWLGKIPVYTDKEFGIFMKFLEDTISIVDVKRRTEDELKALVIKLCHSHEKGWWKE